MALTTTGSGRITTLQQQRILAVGQYKQHRQHQHQRQRQQKGPLLYPHERPQSPRLCPRRRTFAAVVTTTTLFILFAVLSSANGAVMSSTTSNCEFPPEWAGLWFQSGVPHKIKINSTHIQSKGQCIEKDKDKFLIFEMEENCYRCVVINLQHPSVLQYKETYCGQKGSLQEICYGITGDAPLWSMFRSEPRPKPEDCPFKGAPFTFTYNRGQGDCTNPPSRAESCTDDSRLILKYQACPDVRAAESTVEELICLAVWREGSTRYMVGRVLQQDRRSSHLTDEEQYRCFIYERINHPSTSGGHHMITYNIAQSGDATCSGLQNAVEGSKTMKLTTVDDHHNRCRFPLWLTEHHTWQSLDQSLSYQFSVRNATLKVKKKDDIHHGVGGMTGMGGSGTGSAALPYGAAMPYSSNVGGANDGDLHNIEPFHSAHSGTTTTTSHHHNLHAAHLAGEGGTARLICHGILEKQEKKKVQIVAHVTAGCKSGHVCIVFHKRDSNVIEVQQSTNIEENPDEACRHFDPINTPYTTLIPKSLHPKKCPHLGRYTVVNSVVFDDKRKRRQNLGLDNIPSSKQDCSSPKHESFTVGCGGSPEIIEQKSSCPQSTVQNTNSYTCHGAWEENGTSYLIATPNADNRKSTDPHRYCFIYNFYNKPGESPNSPYVLGTSNPSYGNSHNIGMKNSINDNLTNKGRFLRLTAIADNCHRITNNNSIKHAWTMNLTTNGTCADADNTNLATRFSLSAIVYLLSLVLTLIVIR